MRPRQREGESKHEQQKSLTYTRIEFPANTCRDAPSGATTASNIENIEEQEEEQKQGVYIIIII